MRRTVLAPVLLLVATLATLASLLPACGGTPPASTMSCAADVDQADDLVRAASSSSTTGCTEDSDCEVGHPFPTCDAYCAGAIVSKQGAAAWTSAIDAANRGPCSAFAAGGCSLAAVECPDYPGYSTPQCIAATCVPGLEADWTSFTVQVEPADVATLAVGECPSGCTGWTVTADGQITGGASPGPMTADDFAVINGTLRDPGVRLALVSRAGNDPSTPFLSCPPPLDAGVGSSTLILAAVVRPVSGELEGDITDCAVEGGNPFGRMYAVLQKY